MRSMVAERVELSRSLFVARSRDVIGMERDWCGAWWRGALSSRGVCLWHGVLMSSVCGIGATFVSTRKSGGKSRLRLDKCRKKENKKYLKKTCRKEDPFSSAGNGRMF